MTIRATESRIPAGFTARDFGEASQVDSGGKTYALVSYLTSPIAQGSTIDYVVFVVGETPQEAPKYSYRWTVTHLPSETTEVETTTKGVFRYDADISGEVRVRVDVLRDSTVQATLPLNQQIRELDPALEALLNPTGMLKHINVAPSLGSLGGNPRTSRELVNSFRRYVFDAVGPAPKIDLPARYVAAVLYAEVLRVEKGSLLGRDNELDAAAAELNDESSLALGRQSDNALGVAQIAPQTLAMLVGPTQATTFTPWTELPGEPDKRAAVRDQILATLDGLANAADVKIDLFNLLRFPKSNINMCARLLRALITRASRWPKMTAATLISNDPAMALGATEYQIGATQSPLPPTVGPPAATDAHANAFGGDVVQQLMRLPPVVLFFTDATSNGASAYGGFDLQRDDNDDAKRWEGKVQTAPVPAGEGHYVETLQQDLAELKFAIVGGDDGGFGPKARWAVREFQIYAGMPNVAVETGSGARYVDQLRQVPNVLPYSGPVSGQLNAATRVALQYWKVSKWRCPVVISAEQPANQVFSGKDNIWGFQEVGDYHPDVYARDFTGYYGLSPDQAQIIGMENPDHGGPVSMTTPYPIAGDRKPAQALVPVTPDELLGVTAATLHKADTETTKKRSTYKVVRAIAEVESVGYFDSVNARDSAIISIGMYHWTLGLGKSTSLVNNGEICSGSMCDGEMCAFLALLKVVEPDAFARFFGRFGVDIDRGWWSAAGANDGEAFFNKSLYKYAGWLRVQASDGTFADLERTTAEANYFRNWHWFYRVMMASRQGGAIRRLNWPFTRIRIRDILRLPLRRDDVPGAVPGSECHLGDLFTSEQAIAVVLRAHVNSPRTICFNGTVSHDPSTSGYDNRDIVPKALRQAVNVSSVPGADPTMPPTSLHWSQSPAQWGDNEEGVLVQQLLAVAKASFDPGQVGSKAFDSAVNYTWDGETLSKARGSFKLYDADLPPAPPYA